MAKVNLVSIYNTRRKNVKVKFNENENAFAQKSDLTIFNHFSNVGGL